MKFLVVVGSKQDPSDHDRFNFFLESRYSATIQEVTSLFQATEAMKACEADPENNPKIELMILIGPTDPKATVMKFCDGFAEIPILISSDPKHPLSPDAKEAYGPHVEHIDLAHLVPSTVHAVDAMVEKKLLNISVSNEVPHCRIKTNLLLAVCPLQGDVFIRIGDDKYIKLFHRGDTFDRQDLEKYTVRKGVEYLYILKDQCNEFTEKLTAQIAASLNGPPAGTKKAFADAKGTHEAVQELIKNLGFTPQIQKLVKTQVTSTLKNIQGENSLTEMMKKLQSMEGQYLSSHSTLCSYLSCAIAAQLEWGAGPTLYKLILASFMHDITLENQELAALRTIKDLEQTKIKFTPQEHKAFREHPTKAADLVAKMPEIPPDVDTIVRQHHERPNGKGFPSGIEQRNITPLSSVFIVAHDLADYTLEAGEHFNLEVFLQQVRDDYQSKHFKKILSSLEVLRKL